MQNINIIEGFLILFRQCNRLPVKENDRNKPLFMPIILTKGRIININMDELLTILVNMQCRMLIQGVPGGMCQTSEGCSLC